MSDLQEITEFRFLLREEKKDFTYAALEEKYAVNRFYLWSIINLDDYKPSVKVARKLGIKMYSSIISIDGEVPDGAQALRALLCECGQWFISNHPRRKRCFVCSPFRRRIT